VLFFYLQNREGSDHTVRETAVIETETSKIMLKEAKYIALSLAVGILLGCSTVIGA
jgi:hypothetical protein